MSLHSRLYQQMHQLIQDTSVFLATRGSQKEYRLKSIQQESIAASHHGAILVFVHQNMLGQCIEDQLNVNDDDDLEALGYLKRQNNTRRTNK